MYFKYSVPPAPASRSAHGLALGCNLPTPIWGGGGRPAPTEVPGHLPQQGSGRHRVKRLQPRQDGNGGNSGVPAGKEPPQQTDTPGASLGDTGGRHWPQQSSHRGSPGQRQRGAGWTPPKPLQPPPPPGRTETPPDTPLLPGVPRGPCRRGAGDSPFAGVALPPPGGLGDCGGGVG